MSIRMSICLIFILLLAGCRTTTDQSNMPMIKGKVVEIHLLNGAHGNVSIDVSKQFATQKPEELDLPLHLEWPAERFWFADNEFSEYSIRFGITPQGNVINVRIVDVSPNTRNDFLSANFILSQWRFTPPMHAGVPTGYCCVLLTIER